MEKEYLINRKASSTIKIISGKIDSFREKEEIQRTVRVYDQGYIGVAGAIGSGEFESLEKQATKKLENKIAYVENLSNEGKKSIVNDKTAIAKSKLMGTAKRVAQKMTKVAPRFLINGKISLNEVSNGYKNSKGSDLEYANGSLNVSLQLKDRDSSNICDAFYGAALKSFGAVTEKKLIDDVKTLHDAYFLESVTLQNGKYPVILSPYYVFNNVLFDITAKGYVSGASLFYGKLGEKILNDNFTVAVDRNPKTVYQSAFFDAEGEIAKDYRSTIIENGVLKSLLTTKKTAKQFNLPPSKTAGADYDEVPRLDVPSLYFKPTAPNLSAILKEEKAVYVYLASGGDVTTDGTIGLPVILAFLVENGKIVAKINGISVSGNIKDILGCDFMGVSEKDIFELTDERPLVARMEIINDKN